MRLALVIPILAPFGHISFHIVQPILIWRETTHLVPDCRRRGFSLQVILPQRLPANIQLLVNSPNPSNPETWVSFDLSQDTTVTIGIYYDVQSQRIRRLQLGQLTGGRYVTANQAAYWDGKTQEGEVVASGTYFYFFLLLTGLFLFLTHQN